VPLAHGGAKQVYLVGDPVQLPATVMSQVGWANCCRPDWLHLVACRREGGRLCGCTQAVVWFRHLRHLPGGWHGSPNITTIGARLASPPHPGFAPPLFNSAARTSTRLQRVDVQAAADGWVPGAHAGHAGKGHPGRPSMRTC